MILLLGGTSDARELAAAVRAAGYDVLVSTVSATRHYLAGGCPQDWLIRPRLGQRVGRSAIDRAGVDQEDQPKDRK